MIDTQEHFAIVFDDGSGLRGFLFPNRFHFVQISLLFSGAYEIDIAASQL